MLIRSRTSSFVAGSMRLGYRFRKHVRSLPGRPDVVFFRRRVAVFVHGCFWHRHACRKTHTPRSREQFWQAKFAGNVARDRRDQQRLTGDGWRIFIAWECEIEADNTFMARLVAFLGPPRAAKQVDREGTSDACKRSRLRGTIMDES